MRKRYVFSWSSLEVWGMVIICFLQLSFLSRSIVMTWDWGMSGDSQANISVKAKEISSASFSLFTQSRKASTTLD